MKKIDKKVDAFIDSLNENEGGMVAAFDENNKISYANYASVVDIAAAVATILSDYYDDDVKHASTFARGIAKGVAAFIEHGSKGSIVVASEIADACSKRMESNKERILSALKKILEVDDDDINDDDNDDENCETCSEKKTCPLPQAVKYRKENGIPSPNKKNKKGGKGKKQQSCN